MGKIPARGFITKLYSATAPTVSKYGKNMLTVNRPGRLHFLWVISLITEYEYEFFSEHFIHNNTRGIHHYS